MFVRKMILQRFCAELSCIKAMLSAVANTTAQEGIFHDSVSVHPTARLRNSIIGSWYKSLNEMEIGRDLVRTLVLKEKSQN